MTSKKIRLVLCGATGRMGRRVAALAPERNFSIEAGCENLKSVISRADVVLDFSVPEASLRHLEAAAAQKKPFVCGVTGLSGAQQKRVARLASRTAVVWASNMSAGVCVLRRLVRLAAGGLAGFDPSIVEIHHAQKVDAPSGTALALAQELSAAGSRRPPISSIRGGDVVGEHRILFAGVGEQLELIHRAASRDVFAIGALRAARWIYRKPAGFYTLEQVLGLAGQ
ncbi:MAG: 4-hydroxy-tetrahydrodipicolinate reductase [Elusimicrobia bacterium]|nr:4-hydroxy-tetrahydrodipicolinate reductase [Elusimicrobiota bacterium]